MPIFDVLRVDEKHIAKVKAARSLTEVDEIFDDKMHSDFIKWYNSITKVLSKQKAATSCVIIHTFD